jgi:membrane protein implicated in regulation of membrane protease activity
MTMEKKPNKTGAIIATVAAILLCGLPGLCLLCPGGIAVFAKLLTYENVGVDFPQWAGWAFMCLAVIFIAIAVLVPVLTLRTKKPKTEEVPLDINPQEPIPPTS